MRNVAETFVLPPDPEYLDFPRSDGSVSTWPPNTTRVVDHEGHVNYYESLQLEHAQAIRWRVLVGEAAALKMKLPPGPNYVLRNFPDGYRLYDHNKGPSHAPRHDLYLFGPLKKRFRSINEFIPHAIWLLGNSSDDCECKYCAKKSQREITASMSNILRTTPTQSPTPTRVKTVRDKGKGKDPISRIREPRQRDTRVYAAVQRAFKHMKPSPGVLKQPMLVERSNDLIAIYSNTSMELRRWFREGEVVWCALDPPIPPQNGDIRASIEFWPGVVDEVKLKTNAIPREDKTPTSSSTSHPNADDSQASTSTINPDPTPGNTRGPVLDNEDEPLWTVRQSTRYKVQLLAVSHSYTIDDQQVLPYQAYVPTDELINAMINFPAEKLDFDKDSLAKFNPCPGPAAPTFFEAVPAYATALQIASILSSTWCLTDDYEISYSIPPKPTSPVPTQPLPVQPPSQPSPPLTIQDAIQQAYQHNANVSNSHSYYRSVTSVNPDTSHSDIQKVANRVLGVPPPPAQLIQRRFQGLWWGAERIWADDFIRLKIPRCTLAPRGGPNILTPSGPGKSVEDLWVKEGKDPALLGAGTRGVFLRLDGLITVDVPNEVGTTKKEARVCGMLYELADEDWEDPNEPKATNDVSENSLPSTSQTPQSAGPSTTCIAPVNGTSASKPQKYGNPSHIGPGLGDVLPQPPIGYKFRPILSPGYEFVGAMGLISGRYYPRILCHPKIQPRVQAALCRPIKDGGVTGFDNLWALEGLSGGYFNSVDPHRYKRSRVAMMQDADREALRQLQEYAETERVKNNGTSGDGEDAMEVDEM
ncbi:hypothetical protein GALMADRAFT_241134 [Galerina marginata CBS 339.88]|uniref:Cryptic loci regulator 2 N-terminal domain-containing protein n=1 Tax=Galerina marginata (strain CBS 339.88) TaxID=685588 RepID=A0A067TED0_GALM3|nr:hypothetical protein GALMADRAFT_241134 [Galerina marginata CBS 339.88]